MENLTHTASATAEGSTQKFVGRHIGPNPTEIKSMLRELKIDSLDDLAQKALPASIRAQRSLTIGPNKTEVEVLTELKALASKNKIFRSFIGMGYSDCHTPPVIQRNIFENPGWYTQYTPYQAEIAQGRLEALLNFQTMISDLTQLPIANASMLDEGTAAAEAMNLCFVARGKASGNVFFASKLCHPQTLEILKTRAEPLGIKLVIGNHTEFVPTDETFGALVQYPTTYGCIPDYKGFADLLHSKKCLLVAAVDLLSLCLLSPPGEWGADVAVGSAQRFGVPLGYGGPHAGFLSTKDEYKRLVPGRIVGLSQDVHGRPAARLALQTREQHIRRDKATSNICTAQVLLAVMASMYAVYHGPEGLKQIARRIHTLALRLRSSLLDLGFQVGKDLVFDTLHVRLQPEVCKAIVQEGLRNSVNLRVIGDSELGISLDETTELHDVDLILKLFQKTKQAAGKDLRQDQALLESIDKSPLARKSEFLTQPVFSSYHSETEMLRYIRRLEKKDLSLTTSMIPLGSCTMKLNATSEMLPVSWPEFSKIHPFVPLDQVTGYQQMLSRLEETLQDITGFSAVSLQPNAGSQGEYAGLLAIRRFHASRNESHRNLCLIPKSAHGTNPATASMAGMQILNVECDAEGNIDLKDLESKAQEHQATLAALMVTYPSTHGVFEEGIKQICEIVHRNGGQVYMDGANMNAQVGLARPGDYGPDVCHLNLHKTFCIPHGGGGPGMGPIAVAKHLAPFLPAHPVVKMKASGLSENFGTVSAAPWGSASILPISWMYIEMMGSEGLKAASQVAILNANYIATKLSGHYKLLFKGSSGLVAHECILDFRPFKETAGVEVEDVAKRLMDYGFHAPTVSFPVAGTMMIEPTESESKTELDRFCEALILIRQEIREIEEGKFDKTSNLLKNAPHTAEEVTKEAWARPYSRHRAAFPTPSTLENKFWPSVGRINNVLGDRNLVCTCSG